jgi:hypothetical protein
MSEKEREREKYACWHRGSTWQSAGDERVCVIVLRECLFKDTYSSKLSQILNKQYLTGEYLDRIQITDAPDKRMQKIAYRVAKTQCQWWDNKVRRNLVPTLRVFWTKSEREIWHLISLHYSTFKRASGTNETEAALSANIPQFQSFQYVCYPCQRSSWAPRLPFLSKLVARTPTARASWTSFAFHWSYSGTKLEVYSSRLNAARVDDRGAMLKKLMEWNVIKTVLKNELQFNIKILTRKCKGVAN